MEHWSANLYRATNGMSCQFVARNDTRRWAFKATRLPLAEQLADSPRRKAAQVIEPQAAVY